MEKVRANYLKAFDLLGGEENILIVDGTKSVEEIAEEIWKHVEPILEK